MSEQEKPKPTPPAYRRGIREIQEDLKKPIPASLLKTKSKGNNAITFVSWYDVVKMLDWYAPGWCYEIRDITPIGGQTTVVARITIPAAEGDIYREAAGIEDDEVKGYGDTTSNAESMALRRCAAKFGLGLYLYDKKG